MSWIVLILIAIVWLIVKASEGVSKTRTGLKKRQDFSDERNKKFPYREIDSSKNLFERNRDIISRFETKISAHSYSGYSRRHHSYQNYHIENETRDCINDICLAENEPASTAKPWTKASARHTVRLSASFCLRKWLNAPYCPLKFLLSD